MSSCLSLLSPRLSHLTSHFSSHFSLPSPLLTAHHATPHAVHRTQSIHSLSTSLSGA